MRLLAALGLLLLLIAIWLMRGTSTTASSVTASDASVIRVRHRDVVTTVPTLRGVVVARDTGERLGEARVVLVDDGGTPIETVIADAEGEFSMPPREGRLFARARGYATPALVNAEDEVVLVCDRALAIHGHVVSHGVAIADASVRAVSLFELPTVRTTTDADGHFEFLGMTRDSYDLVVEGESLVKLYDKLVEVDDRDVDVEIEVEVGATIRGRVEPPIAARVTSGVHVVDAVDGAFELRGVIGEHDVIATASDGSEGRVHLEIERDVTGVVIHLEPRALVSGTIVDLEGHPLAGALAVDGFAKATTEADGKFRLVGLAAGSQHVVARWPDHGEGSTEELWLKAGEETRDVVLKLAARDHALRGRVLRDGRPVAGVSVQARAEGHQVYAAATSDADGGFLIAGVLAGQYDLIARTKGWRGQVTATADVPIEIALGKQASIVGRVTLDGVPVPVFDLSCSGPERVEVRLADLDGRYRVDDLTPGEYTCQFETRDGEAMSLPRQVDGETKIDMAIDRFATVIGRVVDARTGAPVAGVGVQSPHDRDWIDHYRSGADGRFKIERVQEGKGQIRAVSDAGIWPGLGTDGSYDAHPNELVDVGDVRIIPSRKGKPGTVGLDFDSTGLVEAVRGPAEAAGIERGDHIRAVDGITDPPSWMLMIGDNLVRAGEVVHVELASGLSVTLTAILFE